MILKNTASLATLEYLLCRMLQWGLLSHLNVEKAQGIPVLLGDKQTEISISICLFLYHGKCPHNAVGEEFNVESTWKHI